MSMAVSVCCTVSFCIVVKASAAVFDGAAAVDDTEKDFFSAFPIKTDLVQMVGPSPSSSGKKLQDIMSSSSSDFTVVRRSISFQLPIFCELLLCVWSGETSLKLGTRG